MHGTKIVFDQMSFLVYCSSMNNIIENLEIVEALCHAIARLYTDRGDEASVGKAAALGSMQGFVAIALSESPSVRMALKNRMEELGLELPAV